MANALAAAGETARAELAYQSVLELNPLSECAAAGLLALGAKEQPPAPTPPDPCKVAIQLDGADATEEAKKVLVESVKTGTSDCAAVKLDEISRPDTSERAAAAAAALATFAPLAALIALVAVMILTLVNEDRWLRLRRLWAPSLVFSAFADPCTDPKPGDAVTALTAAAWSQDLRISGAEPDLSLVDAHFELASVADDLAKIDPRLSPLGGLTRLIDRLSRTPRLTVSGQLHAAGSRGPGVTLRMDDRGVVVGADTLTSTPVPSGTPVIEEHFGDLGMASAAWVQHSAGKSVGSGTGSRTTESSTSYAYLMAGQESAKKGDFEAALNYYERSLEADPEHVRALVARALAFASTDASFETISAVLVAALESTTAALGEPAAPAGP